VVPVPAGAPHAADHLRHGLRNGAFPRQGQRGCSSTAEAVAAAARATSFVAGFQSASAPRLHASGVLDKMSTWGEGESGGKATE
jgi:hypothetical protein